MSLGPILPGRLPNSFAASRLTTQIQSAQTEMQRLQDQLTTGQKYLVGSEDPASALRTIILQKRIEQNQQFTANVQTDQSLLSATDNAYSVVSDSINQVKSLVLQGIGNTVSVDARQGLATEVDGVIEQLLNTANTTFRGRYLFGGSQSGTTPFELLGNGQVRYNGDTQTLNSLTGTGQLVANNLDGVTAFNALTTIDSGDLNVALTSNTRLSDLHAGRGLDLGSIKVTVDDGTTSETKNVDLTSAHTIGDVKVILEDAFSGSSVNLTVDVDPASQSGLRVAASTGTVAISNVEGSRVASDLGIASSATATINGSDLDPRVTLNSKLSDLNGGTGIGATTDNGLLITNGSKSGVVDLSSVVTVEDLFNQLQLSGLDVAGDINASGRGIAVSSRVSGAEFSIGENNGSNATLLGLRTLTGDTKLADLNLGQGVPLSSSSSLSITRRDGSNAQVDLSSATTIQDVLDAINSVDPGNLTASLNRVGNGISLLDNSGTGPLSVASDATSQALGIAGTESGSDNTVPLVGQDVAPHESQGILGLLSSLSVALRNGDDLALTRLNGLLDQESSRTLQVRGDLGTRLKSLDNLSNRLADENVRLNDDLSNEFDADLSQTLTSYLAWQQSLQGTYQVASKSFSLSLLAYL
ncbi:flagellar hook-associated protein 3 [bacterium]|nr:flagellar hook-associated protein 3 [bacterium]